MNLIKKNKIIIVFYIMAIFFTYALMFRIDNLNQSLLAESEENNDVVLINYEQR